MVFSLYFLHVNCFSIFQTFLLQMWELPPTTCITYNLERLCKRSIKFINQDMHVLTYTPIQDYK